MKKILSLFLAASLVTLGILTFAQPQAAEAAMGGLGSITITNGGNDFVVGDVGLPATVSDGVTGTGGEVVITGVDAGTNAVTSVRISKIGSLYTIGAGATATGVGTTGTTFTLNITNVANAIAAVSFDGTTYHEPATAPYTLQASGGDGVGLYTALDICTISGGNNDAQIRIDTVVAGVITAATVTQAGTGYADGFYSLTGCTTPGGVGALAYITILQNSSTGAVSDTIIVTQNVTSEITMTAALDVAMGPDLPGMSGGYSSSDSVLYSGSGNPTWNIKTNDTSGFTFSVANIDAGSGSALAMDATNVFTDFTLDGSGSYGADAAAGFDVAVGASVFGYTIVSATTPAGIQDLFREALGACNAVGGAFAAGNCWAGFNVVPQPVFVSSAATPLAGEDIVLQINAGIGASKYQQEGAYTATIVVTAATN